MSELEQARDVPVIPGWRGVFVGTNIYRYRIDSEFITMTGSDADTQIQVPKGHRLLRIELLHTTSGDASPGANTKTITVYKYFPNANLLLELFRIEDLFSENSVVIPFGEGWEHNQTVYRLRINATNTDRIYPELYVQYLRQN